MTKINNMGKITKPSDTITHMKSKNTVNIYKYHQFKNTVSADQQLPPVTERSNSSLIFFFPELSTPYPRCYLPYKYIKSPKINSSKN